MPSELIADNQAAAWLSVVRAIVRRDSGDVIGICGIAILRGSDQGEI